MQIFLHLFFYVVFCHNIQAGYRRPAARDYEKERKQIMRLRKEQDEMLEEEVLLIAQVSDALAHPARINIFRYIMQSLWSLKQA